MKSVPCTKYICDFCGKKYYHKGWMSRHEKRCTMNPERKCGFCDVILGEKQPDLELLKSLLPELENKYDIPSKQECNEALKKIRKITECPTCILSAIRQKGIPVPIMTDFDYKKECQSCIDDYNEANRESPYD